MNREQANTRIEKTGLKRKQIKLPESKIIKI